MSTNESRRLMESAWSTRRRALSSPAGERAASYAQAREDLVRAVELARSEEAVGDLAQALHLLANVEQDLEHTDAARALWVEAVGLLRGAEEPLQLAHKLRHLGDLDREAGRLDDAEAALVEVLRIYRSHAGTDPLDLANALRRVALLAQAQGDPESARRHWREARQLYEDLGIQDGVDEADERLRSL